MDKILDNPPTNTNGSSTDISRSVIAYYDHLTNNRTTLNSLSQHKNNTFLIDTNSSSLLGYCPAKRIKHPTIINADPNTHSKPLKQAPPLPKLPPPSIHRPCRNFRSLSANVQRIISHSSTALDLDDMSKNHTTIDSANDSTAYQTDRKRINGKAFVHPLSKVTSQLADRVNELVIEDLNDAYEIPAEIVYSDTNYADIENGNQINELDVDAFDTTQWTKLETMKKEHIYEQIVLKNGAMESSNGDTNVEDDDDDRESNGNITNVTDVDDVGSDMKQQRSFVHANSAKLCANGDKPESPTLSQRSSSDSETRSTKSQLFAICAQANGFSTSNERDTAVSVTLESMANDIYETISNDTPSKDMSDDAVGLQQLHNFTVSSASIYSSNSASSSASDEQSSNKQSMYLASNESLAEHSENGPSKLTPTECACLEIIESERAYNNELNKIIQGYLNDWKERACFRADELETLFSNIQDVYDSSVILLGELEQSGLKPTKIADCFIKLKDKFDAYTHYCTGFLQAMSLFRTLQQNPQTNALLISTQKNLQHKLSLDAFLLTPVQRITRYQLLLESLRKHSDDAEVEQALQLMISVAKHIDQVKGDYECKSRVREYASILDGWLGPDLTVFGNLILDGTLRENNKQRLVLLFETMLIITKEKEDKRLQFKHFISARNLSLDDRGEPTSFSVIHFDKFPRIEIKLTALTRNDKRKWTHYIKKVMLASCNVQERIRDELIKLGDESDPITERTNWNSTKSITAPTISKNQRKLSNGIGEPAPTPTNAPANEEKKTKALDSLIKELHKRNSVSEPNNGCNELPSNSNNIPTITNDYEIPFDANKALPKEPTSLANLKIKSKFLDVGFYNGRANSKAKRERSKTLKVTSKFYMDLPDFSNTDTVLKITESTDNINLSEIRLDRRRASLDASDAIVKALDEKTERKISLDTALNNNRESDIISELLKHHKEFDRILNKSSKTKIEPDQPVSSQAATKYPKFVRNDSILHSPLPPPPPDVAILNGTIDSDMFIQRELPPEPIYESLLRNVHVPYKFPSPTLNRSLSHLSGRFMKVKRPAVAPPKRPDSSDATMSYNQSFDQNSIEDDYIEMPKSGSQFCQSDTNINYETLSSMHPIAKTAKPARALSELDYGTSILLATSVAEQLANKHKRIIHKQGSRSIGARFATVDYVDAKTLSIQNLNKNASNHSLAHGTCDSAVSLTSSSDSVNLPINQEMALNASEQQHLPAYANQLNGNGHAERIKTTNTASPCHSSSSGDDSYYEKTVETYLENDGIFRDSAFYSDDNIEKVYVRQEHIYSTIDEVKSEVRTKPAPPPKLSLQKIQSIVSRTAPPIPRIAKPGTPRGQTNSSAGPPKMSPPKLPIAEPASATTEKRASTSSEYQIASMWFNEIDMLAADESHEHDELGKLLSEFSLPPPTSPPPPPPIPPRSNLNKKSTWIQKKCELFEK